jgi:hypothetical protein
MADPRMSGSLSDVTCKARLSLNERKPGLFFADRHATFSFETALADAH